MGMNKDKRKNESSRAREVAVEDDLQMVERVGFSTDFLLMVINGTSDNIFV